LPCLEKLERFEYEACKGKPKSGMDRKVWVGKGKREHGDLAIRN